MPCFGFGFFRVIFLPTTGTSFAAQGRQHIFGQFGGCQVHSWSVPRSSVVNLRCCWNAGGLYWITGDFWFLGSSTSYQRGIFLNPKIPKTQMASVGLKSYPDGVAKGGCLGMLSMRFHHGNSWIVPWSSRNRTWFIASDAICSKDSKDIYIYIILYIIYIYPMGN